MSIKTRAQLKAEFVNGSTPVQEDFWDLIDSMISHSDDGLAVVKNSNGTYSLGLGGIRQNMPAPLSIRRYGDKQRFISFHDEKDNSLWSFAMLNTKNVPGFNLLQLDSKNAVVSRLFVESSTGNVGIGTELPKALLQLYGQKNNGGLGLGLRNSSVASQAGWFFLHNNDNSIPKRNGALGIYDSNSSGSPNNERLVITPAGYVGINEKMPDTLLHVSRPESNADSMVDLRQDTGIAQIGTINKSILFDYQGIQARRGTYVLEELELDVTTLNLQRLGGDTLWHGAPTTPETEKVVIKTDGRVGIGVLVPSEKLHIDGRLIISDSTETAVAGAIRWSGTDFEGFDGTSWVSMTGGTASMWATAGTGKITYNATDAMVGIGLAVPTAALHVANDTSVTAGSKAVVIANTAATSGTEVSDNRIGLEISCSGLWSETPVAKSIGLVASASGSSNVNANLAAVLNGNVSIGPVSNSQEMVGFGGTNVLVIQNGVAPATQVGGDAVNNGGVQIYSENNAVGVSIFTIKNGNGNKIQLFKGAALTAANAEVVGTTYTTVEADIITNLRTRLNEMEARLRALGLLV